MTYATLPAAAKTNQQIHIPACSNTGFSSQHYLNSNLVWKPGNMANGWSWFSLPTTPIIPVALVPESAWLSVTPLLNGWANYGTTSFPGASVWHAPDGIMHWRGLIASGPVGSVIHNITSPFGPSGLGQILMTGLMGEGMGRFDMGATVLSHNFGLNNWVSLDGINYLREG